MKSFRQFINEALDRPYPWRLVEQPYKIKDLENGKGDFFYWEYEFNVPGGYVQVQLELFGSKTRTLEVVFIRRSEKSFNTGITGDGDAFRVFATVFDILKSFVKNANFTIDKIQFTAKEAEKSRVRLYDRFAKRYGKVMGFGKVSTKPREWGDGCPCIEYTLTRS